MKLSIIKYNAGNIQSVLYALERIGLQAEVTNDHDTIRSSDKVIFPGVGEAYSAMQSLRENNLDGLIRDLKQPVLGICVGMQLMCNYSEERNTSGLGIFNVAVKRFPSAAGVKIPQVGWNKIYDLDSPLFKGVNNGEYVYYVHSYYAETGRETIAKTEYGLEYSAALHKDNFYGVQFHAEKSALTGEKIIKNFVDRMP